MKQYRVTYQNYNVLFGNNEFEMTVKAENEQRAASRVEYLKGNYVIKVISVTEIPEEHTMNITEEEYRKFDKYTTEEMVAGLEKLRREVAETLRAMTEMAAKGDREFYDGCKPTLAYLEELMWRAQEALKERQWRDEHLEEQEAYFKAVLQEVARDFAENSKTRFKAEDVERQCRIWREYAEAVASQKDEWRG